MRGASQQLHGLKVGGGRPVWVKTGSERNVFGETFALAKRRVQAVTALTTSLIRGTKRDMPSLPACPYLPIPREGLDWRVLHVFRDGDRGPEFYVACLEYGHSLWQRGFAARSLLCLDRAMGADLRETEALLQQWPMPYAAMGWLIAHTPEGVFVGNPRVHFQHYAGRMNEPRRDQRRWRAWACWAIARAVRPDLPGDPRHEIVEPTIAEIHAGLKTHGHVNEAEWWQVALRDSAKFRRTGKLSSNA